MPKTTVQPKGIGETFYVAVRKSPEGHEWIDSSTLAESTEITAWRVRRENSYTPGWSEANPVVRYIPIRLQAVE